MAAFSRGKQLCFLSSHSVRATSQCHPHYLLPFQQLLRQSTSSKRKNVVPSAGSQTSSNRTAPSQITKPIPLRNSYNAETPHPTPLQHRLKPGQQKISAQVSNPRLTGLSPSAINPKTLHTLLEVPEKIYQSPPHKLYIFSSYTLASFFMLYGGWASTMWTSPPDVELHWTIPVLYGIGSIALVGVGSFTLSNTTGLVNSITAVPSKRANKIHLTIEGSKWVPWRMKKVNCELENCYFTNEIEAVLLSNGGRVERLALGEISILLRPWVWMSRGIVDFFMETKSMFLREHMVGLVVEDGGKWKVDTRGMALGGAEGLDRLIRAERDNSRVTWLVQAGVFAACVTVVYMIISAYRKYSKEQGEKDKELLEATDA